MNHVIRIGRIYSSDSDIHAYRVLVDRLWPRGMSKLRARLDVWAKDIAPTTELRSWYGHDLERYEGFRSRYIVELDSNPNAAAFREDCVKALQDRDVLLLFAAKDASHSNAAVLVEWLERR
ncbi:DUF488 domain-containing protein [Bifidobacterium aquikefiricola]|uniref:DUF488 family protein n=1 Tax=Bifidobacterium aquikefiricola TaxID=3059038 RepID=A0AB39U6M3_9BIFI